MRLRFNIYRTREYWTPCLHKCYLFKNTLSVHACVYVVGARACACVKKSWHVVASDVGRPWQVVAQVMWSLGTVVVLEKFYWENLWNVHICDREIICSTEILLYFIFKSLKAITKNKISLIRHLKFINFFSDILGYLFRFGGIVFYIL